MVVKKNKVMKINIIKQKSFDFAVKIVCLYKQLAEEKEFVISKQLLRSGTSIGANVKEASQGQSKADFIAKLSISLKEAVETECWIELLIASNLTRINLNCYLDDTQEIIKIITAIIKTTKQTK
jgi:four helix bundle protein